MARTEDGDEHVARDLREGPVLRDLEAVELDDRVVLVEALLLAPEERLGHLPLERVRLEPILLPLLTDRWEVLDLPCCGG